jgi:oxalate decarboxylase
MAIQPGDYGTQPRTPMHNPEDPLPAAAPSSSDRKNGIDRRGFIGAGSAALFTAAFALAQARGQSIETAAAGDHDQSASDAGPENVPLRDDNPNTFLPPATDHGEPPTFWNSFSVAHRRVQEGGWSRQVTVADFPISTEIAGVNMRLISGGCRELHWHVASEWSIMLSGNARLTTIDAAGKPFVKDVGKNDLWFFPPGLPHSIQGLEPDGCEFLLVFDDGNFSEGNTTLISDWLRHTPPEVLAKNWGVPEDEISGIYKVPPAGHYIFKVPLPGPLAKDAESADDSSSPTRVAFDFPMHSMAPTYRSKSGEVRVVDSRNFPVSTTTAAAHVIVKPGGLRELHWHENADEWQYYIQGKGRMTVFFTDAKARTADFNEGDVGYVPRTFGHYIENTGDTDLIYLELFRAPEFQDLSLSEWVSHTPPELVMAHLNITRETLDKIPKVKTPVVPA